MKRLLIICAFSCYLIFKAFDYNKPVEVKRPAQNFDTAYKSAQNSASKKIDSLINNNHN
jgi:hypothetical protein